jgi:ell wall binding domain 2 (CWB2)
MARPRLLFALLACAVAVGCGGSGDGPGPKVGVEGDEPEAAADLGFPAFATKNTTRVGGGDPIADAAAVARAVFPGTEPGTRAKAVALVDSGDWRAGVAAAALAAPPIGAPVLLAGDDLPAATREALDALAPTGSREAGDAQVIRVGDVPEPEGLRTTDVTGKDAFELAAAIDRTLASARGRTSDRVVITGSERAELAIPAAGWAAKSGDPVLFTEANELPAATRAALRSHQQPKIYILGGNKIVSEAVERQLRRLGSVKRIEAPGDDPVATSIAFARYVDGAFGWGVVDPGHGLVFINAKRPLDAAAAAPLSASGKYGPMLVHEGGPKLAGPLESYLLDIQPGYRRDPVRGVYNHGWVIGDEAAMPINVQSRIDALLEISPIETATQTQQ